MPLTSKIAQFCCCLICCYILSTSLRKLRIFDSVIEIFNIHCKNQKQSLGNIIAQVINFILNIHYPIHKHIKTKKEDKKPQVITIVMQKVENRIFDRFQDLLLSVKEFKGYILLNIFRICTVCNAGCNFLSYLPNYNSENI